MNRYTIHIYATVRVPISVEAETPEAALQQASAEFESDRQHYTSTRGYDTETVTEYMVDRMEGLTAIASTTYDSNLKEITIEV